VNLAKREGERTFPVLRCSIGSRISWILCSGSLSALLRSVRCKTGAVLFSVSAICESSSDFAKSAR